MHIFYEYQYQYFKLYTRMIFNESLLDIKKKISFIDIINIIYDKIDNINYQLVKY